MGRFTTVLVLAGAIVAGTYAFTAANTVPATHAGDGSGVVTGYTVSAIHYRLNGDQPGQRRLGRRSPSTSAPVAGSTMRVQLAAGRQLVLVHQRRRPRSRCTTTAPQATVLAVTSLRVVIAD